MKSQQARISFIVMILSGVLLLGQVMIFSFSERHDLEDLWRCLNRRCSNENLNEFMFWFSSFALFFSWLGAFYWDKTYAPILEWIKTGETKKLSEILPKSTHPSREKTWQINYTILPSIFTERTRFWDVDGLPECTSWEGEETKKFASDPVQASGREISKSQFLNLMAKCRLKEKGIPPASLRTSKFEQLIMVTEPDLDYDFGSDKLGILARARLNKSDIGEKQ